MRARRLLLCSLAAGGLVAGCALGDWSEYASGSATLPKTDGGVTGVGGADGGSSAGDAARVDAGDVYGAVVAADHPVAWWRFEEGTDGETAADELGIHPANPASTVRFGETGISGRAVALTGSGGLAVGDAFDFTGKTSFSLEAWVSTTANGADQWVLGKRDDGAANGPLGYVSYIAGNMTPHFEAWGVTMSCWNDAPMPSDSFVHLVWVVTYENTFDDGSVVGEGNAYVWINGEMGNKHGFANTLAMPDTRVPLELGSSLRGHLDEVAIYDHPLTRTQIQRHHAAGIGTR